MGVAIYGSATFKITIAIEYSLDGGYVWYPWVLHEHFNPPYTYWSPGDAVWPLELSQPSELVQVRGRYTVETLSCYNQCNPIDSSNAGGTMTVYEVWMEVERPELRLFLDVGEGDVGNPVYDFNPDDPASDIDWYVPGSNRDGTSVAVQPEGTALQKAKIIAAYVKPNGKLAAPPGIGTVRFSVQDTSRFKGLAMNAGTSTAADLQLAATNVSFAPDRTARVELRCLDYGGIARVRATRGEDSGSLWVPKDENGNLMSDAGWLAESAPIVESYLEKDLDEDNEPTGSGPPSLGESRATGSPESSRNCANSPRAGRVTRFLDPNREGWRALTRVLTRVRRTPVSSTARIAELRRQL